MRTIIGRIPLIFHIQTEFGIFSSRLYIIIKTTVTKNSTYEKAQMLMMYKAVHTVYHSQKEVFPPKIEVFP